jgi:SAM-dependent methyltransferase
VPESESSVNANLPASHPSVDYYDSDYPGVGTTAHADNLDEMLAVQGLAYDIDRYVKLAGASASPVLELCCGTGRVSIPLVRAGASVVAVDISAAMLAKFRDKLANEPREVRARVELVMQDITQLTLADRRFALALIPFNSLLLLTSRHDQQLALSRAATHLEPGGRLVVDVVNPLILPLKGDPVPVPFLTRRHPDRQRTYTRFAAVGPVDADQRQRLFGWYDEVDEQGIVHRTPYSMWWRPIFRAELELMLESSGLTIESVEGGHRNEVFVAQSPKLFVVARKTR